MVTPSSPCFRPTDKKLIIVLTKDVMQIKTSHLRARRRQQQHSLLHSALLSLCDRMWGRGESWGRLLAHLMISPPLDGGEQQELQIYNSADRQQSSCTCGSRELHYNCQLCNYVYLFIPELFWIL